MTPEIKRRQDESLKDYKVRICSNKDIFNLTWEDIKDIFNEETGDNWGESVYRKWWASFGDGMDYEKKNAISSDEILNEYELKKIELEKERKKLQAIRIDYSRMIREDARSELFEEKLIEAVEKRKYVKPPEIIIKKNDLKRDYLMPIADSHYGVEFTIYGWEDEIINQYNPDIFKKRMWDLLEKYVRKNDESKINHVTLPNLGDSLDGILRMSQLQSLKLGVVDSAIEYAEFMSTWLNELSKYSVVDYYSLQGNHTEIRHINAKRGDFPHENTEKWISHVITCNLKGNKNVNVHKNRYFCYLDILGTKILGVHGQDEKNLEQSIKDYSLAYNKHVDLLLSGHLHHSSEKTIGMNGLQDVEYVQCPSIIGVDDFSMKLKKTSNAGAKLMVIEEGSGRETIHNFKLK